ncbi:SOS response-associated peptidase [Novosphingobium sp. 9U]|uniref:SOS response-associated peptidase n=1 Tax=Novosphingobium sp. 9U TaxID=2653158 RepID=UPI0012F0C39F|nr:SOS response-associated peptidase family protein [Novosphingobium sp. 9U]VWX52835.1 Putative SOS response-associated peptidase [Novosphingobium sp. 9U]
MCNLYRMTKGVVEIAHLFDAVPETGANFAEEVYPGYAGLVVAEGRARTMTWGFPLALRGRQGQALKPKPVTNAREDKLLTGFWLPSFKSRRCLIPVTAWAEAEGRRGAMTRTWYRVDAMDTFAVAGLWRPTTEWGDAYSMVMTEACPQMGDVHDRMPVILAPEHWRRWTDGSADEALRLCTTSDLTLHVDRTEERWAGEPKPPPERQPRLF